VIYSVTRLVHLVILVLICPLAVTFAGQNALSPGTLIGLYVTVPAVMAIDQYSYPKQRSGALFSTGGLLMALALPLFRGGNPAQVAYASFFVWVAVLFGFTLAAAIAMARDREIAIAIVLGFGAAALALVLWRLGGPTVFAWRERPVVFSLSWLLQAAAWARHLRAGFRRAEEPAGLWAVAMVVATILGTLASLAAGIARSS
jgi:hypothetical protein